MKNKKYAFAGNRAFVLQRMRELDLNIVKIWAVRGSYLERYLDQEGLEYTTIGDKNKFLKDMKSTDFDFFISNGLPVILPEEIFGDSKKYVNIHPSLLPDLRGRDPVPGAILYGRDSGATCHLMNKGIDSGDIIAQIEIPHSEDLDAGLLYQLSFMAEADVFESAYDKQFQPVRKQMLRDTDIYYSYQPADMDIDLGKDTAVSIELKVKAFSTGNKGARIYVDDRIFSCSNVVCLQNPYVKEQYAESPWGKILLQYEDQLVVKNIYSELLKFTIKYRGGVNCAKLRALFTSGKLWFPLIVSVIERNMEGNVLMNDDSNPVHAFIVNKFGFCQEVYEEYDEVFFEYVIRPYIERNDRKKLRMYHPGKYMRDYLDSRTFAAKSQRVHMVHRFAAGTADEMTDYQGYGIKEMTKEDVVQDAFGLDLAHRYYNGADDFLKKSYALAAYSADGAMIGVVYSAGEAFGVCEKDIFVKEQFRGQGIAKNLTRAFIQKCSRRHRLVSEDIYESNAASIAVAKAVGAEMIGIYDYYNIEKI